MNRNKFFGLLKGQLCGKFCFGFVCLGFGGFRFFKLLKSILTEKGVENSNSLQMLQ